MKTITKVLIGAFVLGTGAAILKGSGETVVAEGEYSNAAGDVAKWKILEAGDTFSGHVKIPGNEWAEIAQGPVEGLRSLIDDRLRTNGYNVPGEPPPRMEADA